MSSRSIPLSSLATARSGDKGSHVNIGVNALSEEHYPFLVEHLTEEAVKAHFHALAPTEVKRYLLPNLHSMNFILLNVLDGGGTRNLRLDAQGKAMGQALLEMNVQIPKDEEDSEEHQKNGTDSSRNQQAGDRNPPFQPIR